MTILTLTSVLNPTTGQMNPTSVQTIIRPTYVAGEYAKTDQKIVRDSQTDEIQKIITTSTTVRCGENVEAETTSWVNYGE